MIYRNNLFKIDEKNKFCFLKATKANLIEEESVKTSNYIQLSKYRNNGWKYYGNFCRLYKDKNSHFFYFLK